MLEQGKGEEKKERKANEIAGDRGKISIAEEVIVSIAALAAAGVQGLGEMKGGVAEGIVGIFGGGRRGVETENGEEGVRFSLKVTIRYGQPIYRVAQEVQRSVIAKVEEMTGLAVSGVDIYVQKLQFPMEAEPKPGDEELHQRILEVIEDHPEGIKLTDIGKLLGVDWRLLTSAAKRLIAEGEARKEGKRYLPGEKLSP